MTREMSNSFTYTSEPHSAPKLFSQTMPTRGVPLTLMSDPRVVRGNTHSLARKVSKARSEDIKEKYTAKGLERKAQEEEVSSNMPFYSFVTKPFAEEDVDIMKYLVEPDDTIIPTKDCTTQVDDFRPLPPKSKFIPRKTGIDQYTQVEDETELFVFDLEVAPMLEVIVKKTLEQSLIEVEQEYELRMLYSEVAMYEQQMSNESSWMMEQENHIKQKQEDIRHKLNNILAAKAAERQIKLGVAGLQMMHQIVPAMLDDIHKNNVAEGKWYLPEDENVKKNILPATLSTVSQQIVLLNNAEVAVDDLLQAAVSKFNLIERREQSYKELKLIVHIIKTQEPSDDSEQKKERIKEVELEIPIKQGDTVGMLQKKLQENLKQLTATQGEEEGASKDSALTGDFKLLPKINAVIGSLYQANGLPPIDLVGDAILNNFPLGSDIVVYFHV